MTQIPETATGDLAVAAGHHGTEKNTRSCDGKKIRAENAKKTEETIRSYRSSITGFRLTETDSRSTRHNESDLARRD